MKGNDYKGNWAGPEDPGTPCVLDSIFMNRKTAKIVPTQRCNSRGLRDGTVGIVIAAQP